MKRKEIEEIIRISASMIGIDVEFNGCTISKEEKCILKKELIQGFGVDPVLATFLIMHLDNGIDFDWLEMYEDKRALYQINLGTIQGIDMSFSKFDKFTALQLEAIRIWIKRGVDMSDLSYPEIDHRNIRILAEMKKNGFNYMQYVSEYGNPGYLRAYNDLNQKINHLKHKDVFLKLPNVFDVIRLVDEGIDIEKLFDIGFNDLDIDDQIYIFYKLGVSCLNGSTDKVKWAFDHIDLFEIQELKMFNQLITIHNLEELKLLKKSPTEILLELFGVRHVNGDIKVYDAFFKKYTEDYCNSKNIECLKFGLDLSFVFNEKIVVSTRSSIVDILYSMIIKKAEKALIEKARTIFEKSLSLIPYKSNVFIRLADLIIPHTKDFTNVDFSALLDTSIPNELKNEAIVAAKNGVHYEDIVALKFSKYQLTYMLNNKIHKNLLDVLHLGFIGIENLKELNKAAPFLDLFQFEGIHCSSENIAILSCFNDLKSKKGFYILGDGCFTCDTVFLAIDALRLDLDIYPYIKDLNDFYANKTLTKIIEKELNVKNFTSRSKDEFELRQKPPTIPFVI